MPGATVVGRDAERARVAAVVSAAADGPAGLVVEGEAGAGKTSLWEAALASASVAAVDVARCRPVESEASLSYASLADVLGRDDREIAATLPAGQRRALDAALGIELPVGGAVDHRTVAAATLALIVERAHHRPLAIAIDDFQWLDRASARVIGFAFRRLTVEPVRLIATMRSEAISSLHPEHVDLLGDRRIERLRLRPLSLGAVEHVLRDQLELTLPRTVLVQLHRTARGNPLYALELGRALLESASVPGTGEPLPVSDDLRELLVRRLRRLPRDVRDALLLVALLPDRDERTLAHAVGAGWDEAFGVARAEGIVVAVDGRARFVHPLFASAVVADATDRERQDAHHRLGRSVGDAGERVRHSALRSTSIDPSMAADLEEAATAAARRGAPDAAAELAELARSRTPADSPRDLCRRCTIAGEARFAAGDSVRAVELLSEAETAAAAGAERADVLLRLARVRYHHDDLVAARALLEQAKRDAVDAPRLLAAIDHDLAYAHFATANLKATRDHAASAVRLAEQFGGEQILADALAQQAVAEFLLGNGVRDDLLGRACAIEDFDEPRPALLRPTVALAHVRAWSDLLEEARAAIERAEREVLERGDDAALPFLWYHLAEVDCLSGRWQHGIERAMAADHLAVQTRQEAMRALTCYAVALLSAHLGRADEARRYAGQGVQIAAATGHVVGGGLNVGVLGFLDLSEGSPDRAHRRFGMLISQARASGFDEPGSAWWLGDAIEAAVAVGDVDRASELVEWVAARAEAIDRPSGLAVADRGRALLVAMDGRVDEALAACDRALTGHQRAPRPFARGRTLLVKGQIARRARKWGVARSSLDEARAAFEQLGAALWVARTDDALSRVGGRPASRGELTNAERQVADLVAEGRTNREVAEVLFMSPRTVSATLARVYAKLGVASRTEMAAHLGRRAARGDSLPPSASNR